MFYRSVYVLSNRIAQNATLYYEAILASANRTLQYSPLREESRENLGRFRFVHGFGPDYCSNHLSPESAFKRKVKTVYGSSQMDFLSLCCDTIPWSVKTNKYYNTLVLHFQKNNNK